ncbi:hypothetical protein BVRB_6g152540 [Beta vulgaris subsp. vulgaris]|nr:hypothetical protein BVRB_6g152540 [Beta vulgaris subsp. vulgaris]
MDDGDQMGVGQWLNSNGQDFILLGSVFGCCFVGNLNTASE